MNKKLFANAAALVLLTLGTLGSGYAQTDSSLCNNKLTSAQSATSGWGSDFLLPEKALLPDTAGGKQSLLPTCTNDHCIDLQTILYDNEIRGHGRASVSEVDGEGSGAIGVHRVRAGCGSVGKV
jgi:hypothetical protein